MEHRKNQHDIAEEITRLASSGSYRHALAEMRSYASGLLAEGHSREELYAEMEFARNLLEERGAPEESEDSVLDVMDFLVGHCSPEARL